MIIKCDKCGAINDLGSMLCRNCGSPLEFQSLFHGIKHCEKCGTSNDLGTKFCRNCGTSLYNQQSVKSSGIPNDKTSSSSNAVTNSSDDVHGCLWWFLIIFGILALFGVFG